MPSTFGAGTLGFGALTGWAIQSSNSSDENKRANTLNETGNEVVSNLFDDTTQVTTSYKATTTGAPVVPIELGAVINGVTLTGIQLSTDAEDFATMTLTGHIHIDGTHGTVRKATHGISLRAGFGASGFGVTGNTTVRSSDCSITCEHIDVPDEDGDTAAGENYDGKIECTVRVLGSGAVVPSGFDRLANATDASNTDFRYQELRFYKAIAMA
jgi:hypothetical protein